jgi:hypothetical protein
MSLDPDLLHSWLPAHIRVRDREVGEPLRAMMAVVQRVCDELHDDIGGLYRNWFIETAREWVVPYTGDLVGIPRLRAMSPHAYTLRGYVANAIALRRRKGTPGSLEQVAQDVTGWYASVLEMFQTVSTTQHIKHPRPASQRTPALRNADEMDRLYGPFERACHTLDVRNLDRELDAIAVLPQRDRGRYNLQTVSLFLWRLRAWPVVLAPAVLHPASGPGTTDWYHMNQLGTDMPLFNVPQTKLEPASLAQEHHLPGQLRRAALFLELEARRQAQADGVTPVPAWFGAQPPFRIYHRTAGTAETPSEISPSRILVADLTGCDQPGWSPPPNTRRYYRASGGSVDAPIAAVVDPVLGRFVFTSGNAPRPDHEVLVTYHYGFLSDLGGGTYDRHADLDDRAELSRYQVDHATGGAKALQHRLADWLAQRPNTPGAVVEIMDNFLYTLDAGLILSIPRGKHLEIRAANRRRPVVVLGGDVTVALAGHAGLTLNGLWIQRGRLVVRADAEGPTAVSLIHTTLVPQAGRASLQISAPSGATSPPLQVTCTVRRSITGGLDLAALGAGCVLELQDSIVDGKTGTALDHGGVLRARASTVLGTTRAGVLELASDMLFTGTVMSERRQPGIIRFSFAPFGSELPPRFQCQPPFDSGEIDTAREAVLFRLKPRFTSIEYGQPGYCQLAVSMPDEILRGASDEGEIGVWNHLEQSQRVLNLRDALDEYLRLGLEAGLIFVT